MELDKFTRILEEEQTKLNIEQYKQYAGHEYSKEQMERSAARIHELSQEGLDSFSKDQLPRLLYFHLINGTIAPELTRIQNELYRKRSEEVRVTSNGETVSLDNVRAFNYRHTADAALRKKVFDGLLAKADTLTPTVEEQFAIVRQMTAAHSLNPLEMYSEVEQIQAKQLKEITHSAAKRAKPHFLELARRLSPEVLGKDIEYFDDYYVLQHVVNKRFNEHFARLDFAGLMAKTASRLGLDAEAVQVDGKAREGKYASPVCFYIQIPGDVRVLYQATEPYGDYTGYYHELGHGLHFVSIDPKRPFHERALVQSTVAEIFSTLFEDLALDPIYLEEEAGLPAEAIEHVGLRQRFMNLYFLTFYGANSMMKIRYWEEALSIAEADALYAALYQEYTDLPMPGIYWQTHHVAGMSILYAPSYLIANIRKAELQNQLRSEFGQRWWRDPKAGKTLRERYMGAGTAIDLAAFSTLNPEPYFNTVFQS